MKRISTNGLGSYLRDISSIPLLTATEEINLGRKIQKFNSLIDIKEKLKADLGRQPNYGEWAEKAACSIPTLERYLSEGKKAKNHLVVANLRLVVSAAKKYQEQGLELEELIQEGNIGLIIGAERFNPKKGCKFSTFAYWWIRQAIVRGIRAKSRTVRIPENAYEILNKINKATRELSIAQDRTPTITQVAKYCQENLEEVTFYLKSTQKTFSLDYKLHLDEDSALINFLKDKNQPLDLLLENDKESRIAQLFKDLASQEKEILALRFGLNHQCEPKSFAEIGCQFGVSRQAINQKFNRTIAKLRKTWSDQSSSYF